MTGTSALEQTLRHDRLIVAIGIATVVAFSWGYLIAGAGIWWIRRHLTSGGESPGEVR